MWVQPAISAHIVLSSFKLNSSRFCVVGIEKQGIEGTGQKRDRAHASANPRELQGREALWRCSRLKCGVEPPNTPH